MRSALWIPKSPVAPRTASFLRKNQVLGELSMHQVSGPRCLKAVRKERTFPMRPEVMISRALTWAGMKRWLRPIMRNFLAFLEAAIMALASSRVVAMGFSTRTCLPALKASRAWGAWR